MKLVDEEAAEAAHNPPLGHYESDEIFQLLTNLPDDDVAVILGMERSFLGGTSFEQGELFREALVRTSRGERRCPRDVTPKQFVIGVMRSIASHDRPKKAAVREFDEATIDPTSFAAEMVLPAAAVDPETALLAKEDVDDDDEILAAIKAALAGDEECELLLLGWSMGDRGKQLRDAIGCDQERLSYLMKKVRRVADRVRRERRAR